MLLISLESKKVERRPIHLDKQVTYKQLLTEYVPLTEKGSPIYFVDRGCGYVLKLQNDSIVRIDNSFHHQNQFGGAYFLHKGEPYIYGGYGLFSIKNFITHFDPKLKEWYLDNQSKKVDPACTFPYYKEKDNLFILVYFNQFFDKINFKKLWRYNLTNESWIFEGQINYFDSIKVSPNNLINNMLIFSTFFLELDFTNNCINRFKQNPSNSLLSLYKFKKYYIKMQHQTIIDVHSSLMLIYDESAFKREFLIDQNALFVKENDSFYVKFFALIAIFLFGIIFVIFWILRKRKKLSHNYTMSQSSIELLDLWVFKHHGIMELSDLNDLVNPEHLSIETMKKRREALLKTFVFDMAKIYRLSPKNVYTETFNPMDKRMKLLTLHSKIMEIALKKGN
jgi:cbb3-type cytochrome oxidase subunit 3